MTTTKNFLGIPIEGDIIPGGRKQVQQRPIEELGPLLQAVLEIPGVIIRWRQYTPYFNDGDVCEFGVGDITYKIPNLTDGLEDSDWDEDFVYSGNALIKGGQRQTYDWASRAWVNVGDIHPRHPGADAIDALEQAIHSGAFDLALLEAFGDHAIVSITGEKIDVEYYEHD